MNEMKVDSKFKLFRYRTPLRPAPYGLCLLNLQGLQYHLGDVERNRCLQIMVRQTERETETRDRDLQSCHIITDSSASDWTKVGLAGIWAN